MIEFAKLPLDERTPFFQEVATRRGLTRLIVEKGFWVCFTLRLLFNTPELADKFVFKGGTSLSKVFGIIKRFSEDLDLSVAPDWLGFGGENRLSDLRIDYQDMHEMFIEDPPPFNELLRQLNEIEDKINGKQEV